MADISMDSNSEGSFVEQIMPSDSVVSPSKLAKKVDQDDHLVSSLNSPVCLDKTQEPMQENGDSLDADPEKLNDPSSRADSASLPVSQNSQSSPPRPPGQVTVVTGRENSPVSQEEIAPGTPTSCPPPDPITPVSTNGLSCSPQSSPGDDPESSFSISGLEPETVVPKVNADPGHPVGDDKTPTSEVDRAVDANDDSALPETDRQLVVEMERMALATEEPAKDSNLAENLDENKTADPATLPCEPDSLVKDAQIEETRATGGGGASPETVAKPSSAQTPAASAQVDSEGGQIYHIKWVHWHGTKTPIVTQNENGPCPLIAVINVLLLRGQIHLADGAEVVSGQQLFTLLGDCIIRLQPQESLSDEMKKDYERNVSDAINNISKLQTGIDVNVRFTGVKDFEYTDATLLFDILDLTLCHGWLVEPEDGQTRELVGGLSYNQLAELVIQLGQSEDLVDREKVTCLKHFLSSTASQLTYHGIAELHARLQENEMAVFFRNNHFSVLLKSKGELFLLVTDQGFLGEPRVVWETLHTVDGDSHFVDAELKTISPRKDPTTELSSPLPEGTSPEQQIDHDLAMALSLEEREAVEPSGPPETTGDFQLAKQLQEEEDQASVPQTAGGSSGRLSAGSPRQARADGSAANEAADPTVSEQKKKSCNIL